MLGPYFLYREMSREGFKVSIDGHGADELICGYRQFLEPSLCDTLSPIENLKEFHMIKNVGENYGIDVDTIETWKTLQIKKKASI